MKYYAFYRNHKYPEISSFRVVIKAESAGSAELIFNHTFREGEELIKIEPVVGNGKRCGHLGTYYPERHGRV